MQPKEITVFTEGDSENSKVWSNVPYFLTTTLEKKGYIVHRVNVEGNHLMKIFYDKFLCRLLRKTFMKKTSFSYNRSKSYTRKVLNLMQKAVEQHPESCCFLSTSFSYAPSHYTSKPTVLFCDWTYDYYFEYFLKRKPDSLELKEVYRQNEVIEHASHVFVLFPDVAKYMQQKYRNRNIFYLGNVINAPFFNREPTSLSSRQDDAKILFIGLKKYRDGVESLIGAVILLHKSIPNLTLDIIGMNKKDFDKLPSYIHCHGYLDKNIAIEKDLYYSLLDNASVYVNTTPLWAGFSSALESLYHYVPVITTPYPSFTETFGDTINFGYYCNQNTSALIATYIEKLLALPTSDYITFCQNAHQSVSNFTWDSYVDHMLSTIGSH